MKQEDLFAVVNFSEEQLNAMRQIYEKYFAKLMPEKFEHRGVSALWYENATYERGKGADIGHDLPGIALPECRFDPLWDSFGELVPLMAKTATITKMPPGGYFYPHVDRSWRPHAIYFPISGCSDLCESAFYDLPKKDTPNSQFVREWPEPLFKFSINNNAVFQNVHEWHSVQNFSNVERIAFGWNFRSLDFKTCKQILVNLGYLGEQ